MIKRGMFWNIVFKTRS